MMSADPARSFGSVADLYARVRPGYPSDAVSWAIARTAQTGRILDLGAGTGKLTAVIASLGHDVVAVEPDADMRAALQRALPAVDVVAGSAEQLPQDDASVDAVLAGQSYHWFDRPRALPEIARVLRPRGVLGLLWNFREETVPWVAELGAILRRAGDEHPTQRPPPEGDEPWFSPYEHQSWRHTTQCSPEALVELVHSRSYVITAAAGLRASIERAVGELSATHPDLAGRDRFELPYVTHVYRTTVQDTPTRCRT